MYAVIETPTFIEDAERAGLTEAQRMAIVDRVSRHPLSGALMPDTAGARKVRIVGRSKGKSGGYRLITY